MTDEMKEMGCSCHNHPPCSFCEALTEEEANILWNGTMDDLRAYWRKQPEPPLETEDTDTMVKIGGQSFRCHCTCNVFRKVKTDHSKYVCNACGELYQGE